MKTNPVGGHIKATIAWDGAAATRRAVTDYVNWGFAFENVGATPLAADAIFEIVGFKALAANPCAPDPATETPAKEVAICSGVSSPAANFRVVIPAGAVAGCYGGATLPCEIGPFVALKHISGGANIRATLVQTGPRK